MGKLTPLADEMLTLWHDMGPDEKLRTVEFMRAVRYTVGQRHLLPLPMVDDMVPKDGEMPQPASVGRIVHYTISKGDVEHLGMAPHAEGAVRPAVVVQCWPNEYGDKPGYNLQVFLDGANDTTSTSRSGVLWRTSVELSDEPAPGKCHWPPRA